MDCSELTYTFHNGSLFPLISFGTYQINGRKLISQVIDYALYAGYRSFDTATVYHNEEDIGCALKELLPKYKLKRQDIFITSKLPPSHHGEKALTALKSSLDKLDCEYLDLYLIHWPGQQARSPTALDNAKARCETWKHLVEAYNDGLVKNIGVSNYTVKHLEELYKKNYGVKPSANQVEWHPHYHPQELLEYCKRKGILVQAYSSLGGTNNLDLISDPTVVAIAKKLNKTPAQILLRWSLQQRIAIIPKARSRKHIEENIALNFEIPQSDMQALHGLKQVKYAWNPEVVT